jgi:hypothetical protein
MIPISRRTRAEAWLAASEVMRDKHSRQYNVILEVLEPGAATAVSRAIEHTVDDFLRQKDAQPSHTVAETIFPAAEYRRGGMEAVYEYPRTIYPLIKSLAANSWGTYALRLNERACADGTTIKPLELVIKKLKRQLGTGAAKRAAYELDLGLEPLELKLYFAGDDNNRALGGQCLNHISLKLGENKELYMTAVYRYQYFVQKALGNLLGLARLQAAIAREVGIPVGPLVCHATMAILEDRQLESSAKWSRDEVSALITKCRAFVDAEPAEVAA